MKYTNEIIINIPINDVIAKFDNPENMSKWQPTLISYQQMSGELGEVGSKMKLTYQRGKGTVELVETLTNKDLPHKFDATYEAKGVFNTVKNKFSIVDGDKTKWESETDFQFKGFMKYLAPLMKGSFKKESQKIMDRFKAFAES